MKKFQISALQQRQFKAPVTVKLASDEVGKKGEMQYDTIHFVVRFRSVPGDEARKNLLRVEELRNQGNSLEEVLTESLNQSKSYVLGIEKHPEHPFPFLDGENDAESSPELIEQLLNVREIREAIEKTYGEARSGELLAKNAKK
ncbi:hypothetical protein [Rheinheimera sp. 4Y26]|uniref:hypothetical protein n=1 Tax=Rheinheimera sp. 4Y26 TaxID=2977811 RepID=UPI0021B0F11D|nr:hypothetical protein [Rheinheimera sp. 4Y26]MCT6700923.1 hypothetical protein [Rheinheimera sp. 4Y26]